MGRDGSYGLPATVAAWRSPLPKIEFDVEPTGGCFADDGIGGGVSLYRGIPGDWMYNIWSVRVPYVPTPTTYFDL